MRINGYEVGPCTDLRGENLTKADFSSEDLRWANLTKANLYMASLAGADLRGANLTEANLYMADLTGANLRGANLRLANLHYACLAEADLRGAIRGGQVASDLVVRLALLGACSEAVVWAWNLRPGRSWQTAWDAVQQDDWKKWLGGTYDAAVEKLMSVEVKS